MAVAFGLSSHILIISEVHFFLPGTAMLSDPREILNLIGAALTGPVGGLIIGIISCFYDPTESLRNYIMLQHIIAAVLTGIIYKKLLFEKLRMPLLALGWLVLVFFYYFVFYTPAFLILVTFFSPESFPNFTNTNSGVFATMISLYKGWVPEYLFTSLVTTLIILALPEKFRRPLWGKKIEPKEVIKIKLPASVLSRFRRRSSISFRIFLWFTILFLVLIIILSFFLRNYFLDYSLSQYSVSNNITLNNVVMTIKPGTSKDSLISKIKNLNKFENQYFIISDKNFNDFSHNGINYPDKLINLSSDYLSGNITKENGSFFDNKLMNVYSYRYLAEYDFYIIFISNYYHFGSRLHSLTNSIFVNLGGILFVISIIIAFIIWIIIGNPIKKLTRAAEDLGKGQFDEDIPPAEMTDEMKILAETFNEMKNNIKSYQENILLAKTEAEKSNQLKSEFLAQMSHEIRTPVNTILNYTWLIKSDIDKYITPELKDCFKIIENGSKRLIRTIDSIINMSQLQLGTFPVNPVNLNIYEKVLLPLYNEFYPLARQKDLNFTISKDSALTILKVDEYTITQMFANLIDNAIKYTDSGFVQIQVMDEKEYLVVIIQDSGVGIAESYLERIFEPFSQEEQGYTRKYDGNGLGLALVKKYCDLNGAGIKIESKKCRGTLVKIVFTL